VVLVQQLQALVDLGPPRDIALWTRQLQIHRHPQEVVGVTSVNSIASDVLLPQLVEDGRIQVGDVRNAFEIREDLERSKVNCPDAPSMFLTTGPGQLVCELHRVLLGFLAEEVIVRNVVGRAVEPSLREEAGC
jgi:hypothetical protein